MKANYMKFNYINVNKIIKLIKLYSFPMKANYTKFNYINVYYIIRAPKIRIEQQKNKIRKISLFVQYK